MADLGKWLLGVVGWSLGGPIGGVIGFVLGSLFDNMQGITISGKTAGKTRKTTEGDFKISLLVMIAAAMKVDGKVSKSELNEVKVFLRSNFREEEALEMLQILKEILKKNFDYRQVALQINMNMNYSAKLQLLHLLFKVSKADGMVSNSSLVFLKEIAQLMHISDSDFNSLKAVYSFSSGQYRGYSGNFSTQRSVSWAYDVLEIPKTADEKEIKKAYRRMAMKYHPDKISSLGEEVRKTAEEKFKVVNEAYETLKKEKGFV